MVHTGKKFTLFDPNVFNAFVGAGEIIEIRSINGRTVTVGYFDNYETFCENAKKCDRTGANVYITLQVIDPRLLGRSCNRLKQNINTTSDNDVLAYRWLPIDVDPVRPSGVSSSDSELQQAYIVRETVVDWIQTNLGFTNPIRAMSGNGYHLLYRLPDLDNNSENLGFVKNILEEIALRYNTTKVKIDTTVCNPARIWKLYGTTARKGDAVSQNEYREARSHRVSYIEDMGGLNDFS